MKNILFINGKDNCSRSLFVHLHEEGYQIDFASSFMDVMRMLDSQCVDLIFLNEDFPEICSETTFRVIRKYSDAAIVVSISTPSELDRMIWIDIGVDEVVCKNSSVQSIGQCIANVLQKKILSDDEPNNRLKPLTMSSEETETSKVDDLPLSPEELLLLKLLSKKPIQTHSYGVLTSYMNVNGFQYSDSVVDENIGNLRKKLSLISSVADPIKESFSDQGAGYRLHLDNAI